MTCFSFTLMALLAAFPASSLEEPTNILWKENPEPLARRGGVAAWGWVLPLLLLKYGWHPSTHTLESRCGCLCASFPNNNRAPSFASVEGHRRGGFLRSSFLSGEAAVATGGPDDAWHPSASWSLRGLSHTCALWLPWKPGRGTKRFPWRRPHVHRGP